MRTAREPSRVSIKEDEEPSPDRTMVAMNRNGDRRAERQAGEAGGEQQDDDGAGQDRRQDGEEDGAADQRHAPVENADLR